MVNGPGEAAQTEIGITGGGGGNSMLYLHGIQNKKIDNKEMISKIVSLIEKKEQELKNKK